ncbi:MAG: hypothetical protein COA36_07820 [Desulfotalea sp.]|nr:MAG: hypothetical protein COA36_07820 [Desulfotalea sp.]
MNQPHNFIDIHCHILPGLDDGPKTVEGSLAIARCYENLGIKKVIATPHFLPGTAWSPTREGVVESVQKLQKHLDKEGLRLKIEPGMEIAYHKKMAARIVAGCLLPLGRSDYYLIEPAFHGDQDGMLEDLASLLKSGVHIILAHPERIDQFQHKPDLLASLAKQGMLIQVNSGSMLGFFGRKSMETAAYLAKRGLLHIFASDAHNHDTRPPFTIEEWGTLVSSIGGKNLSSCMQLLDDLFTN